MASDKLNRNERTKKICNCVNLPFRTHHQQQQQQEVVDVWRVSLCQAQYLGAR